MKHGSFYDRSHPSHVILKDEDVRKITIRSTHIVANSDAQEQSMNDNSPLDSNAQDRNVNNYSYSLQLSDDSDDESQERHDSERQETMRCVMPSGQSPIASTDNVKGKENPTVTTGKIPQKRCKSSL